MMAYQLEAGGSFLRHMTELPCYARFKFTEYNEFVVRLVGLSFFGLKLILIIKNTIQNCMAFFILSSRVEIYSLLGMTRIFTSLVSVLFPAAS